ncbi:holin [Shewanella surugensis]|uniref:Phage holin family protein n=1 Tax=Shewanella surugensis TaxID=212020 RepID=A0ABT0L7P9_9GAMM|nr:holin [Shewanella surugensis]MCL1123402.1 phage holin family protein [Shewanella surugensis]
MSTIQESLLQKISSTASYGASVSTAAGGVLTENDWVLISGIGLAVLTCVINWGYRAAQNRRDKERHELQTKLLQQQIDEYKR